MTTILGIIIAVLTVTLVGVCAWLAWDTRRIERECREDEDYPTDDELADWWDWWGLDGWLELIRDSATDLEER